MKYIYEGQEFSSIKALAEHVGKNEKTITARLRKGMSVEDSCQEKDLRCTYHEDKGSLKSISEICKEHDKDESLIYNRLKYGYSINDALNKPKKIARQGAPITVKGILYNSVSHALRELKLVHKEGTVRSRLRNGWSPDEAFTFRD